jgi:glycosyltransferase involved in cell wall biosynthesis
MLTVLMATYNGARTLPTVLEAYLMLDPPPDGWKLVIVDNGSADNSKEIINSFGQRLPLTYVFEPTRGKNAALNTGLAYVEGDFIVCTDDDTVPHSDWLVQLRRAADDQPSFSIFGGTVLPRWEIPPEPWILNWVPLGVAYALTDPSWPEGPITPRRIFEPNSGYRMKIFEAGHRFDPAMGPAGTNYPMGSGSEFHVRLMNAGFTAWHCKRAIVEHIVRKSQMQKKWVLRRAFRYGRGQYRQELRNELKSPRLIFGVPRFILREVVMQTLRVAKARMGGDEKRWFTERWDLNFVAGQAYEARSIHLLAAKSMDSPARSEEPVRR